MRPNKINSHLGLLFQIPLWVLSSISIYKFFSVFILSFTKYNLLEMPKFSGVSNYVGLLGDEITGLAMQNTVIYVLLTTLFLTVTAVIPALLISRLKSVFGIAVMGGYSLVSLSAVMPSVWGYIFSSDTLGLLNSYFAGEEPIMWTSEYARIICLLLFCLICLFPVFAITYIFAWFKHRILGTTVAICAIPVIMAFGNVYTTSVVGYPSVNYSADWLATVFLDYWQTRFEVGYACAIASVGIWLFILWCGAAFGAVFGISRLIRLIKPSPTFKKTVSLISLAFCSILFLIFIVPFFICIFNAFKPLDEFSAVPSSAFPLRPTFKNFGDAVAIYGNTLWDFGKSTLGFWRFIPLYITVIIPSSLGFALFNSCRRQWLLFLPFVSLVGLTPYFQLNHNTYNKQVGYFASGLALPALLLITYLVINWALYRGKNRTKRIILGAFCMFSSLFSVGGTVLALSPNTTYIEAEKPWISINSYFSGAGIARLGAAAAGDILLMLFIITANVVALTLLLLTYLSYKKDLKNEET